jgi:hypothetical protein
METIRKAGKPTANMVTFTMAQTPIGKLANTPDLKHVIARRVTKSGAKRTMNASGRKEGKRKITAERVMTSVFPGRSGL